jgi:hypothetical protein
MTKIDVFEKFVSELKFNLGNQLLTVLEGECTDKQNNITRVKIVVI